MPTEKSIAEVEELKKLLSEAKLIISTNYRGLNVTEMSALRRAIRDGGGTYRVAKNTLIKIASDEINRPEIDEIIVGPTGFVLSTDDTVAPARALVTHIEQNRLEVVINGAYLEGQVLDADRVKYLSTLPSRDELVGKLLGQMNAPVANLVGVLSGTIRGLMTVIQAHIDQVGNIALEDQAKTSTDEQAADAPVKETSEAAPAEEPVEEAAEDEPAEAAPDEQAEAPAEEPVAEATEEEPAEEASGEQAEESADEPASEATEEEPAEEAEEAEKDKPAE